jgi:hypothetical protein
MARSLFPSFVELVEVASPTALDVAEEVVIDEDAFHFSASIILMETDDNIELGEWESSLPFSEIAELRFRSSEGRVSGTLNDGSELDFHFVDGGRLPRKVREAMEAVEALFAPKAGVLIFDDASLVRREPSEWAQPVEIAFASAAQYGGETQMRRFAQLTSDAGLEVHRFGMNQALQADWPGTIKPIFELSWKSQSRFSWRVRRTVAFGEDKSEARRALPKNPPIRFANAAETDRFLDDLEAFLAWHPLQQAPDRIRRLQDSTDLTPVSPVQHPAPRSPILSDEEFAAAAWSLREAFEDAAECGVEPQVRRFAQLTVDAGLEVEWVEWNRQLEAKWRKTGKPIFILGWKPEGQLRASLGFKNLGGAHGGDSVTHLLACDAFGIGEWEIKRALPIDQNVASGDAQETDRFLDWLQEFLATHPVL